MSPSHPSFSGDLGAAAEMSGTISKEIAEKSDRDLEGHSAFVRALISHTHSFHLNRRNRDDFRETNAVAEQTVGELTEFLRGNSSNLAQHFRYRVGKLLNFFC